MRRKQERYERTNRHLRSSYALMTRRRWVAAGLLIALFLFSSGVGFYNAGDEFRAATGVEFVVVGSVLTYSVAGLFAAFGIYRRRRWAYVPILISACGSASAAATGSLLYGETDWSVALVSGASVLLFFACVFLLARYVLKES